MLQFWLSDLLAKSAVEGQSRLGEEDGNHQQDTVQLTLHHLQPAFFVLVVGLLMACLVAVCEKITALKENVNIVK